MLFLYIFLGFFSLALPSRAADLCRKGHWMDWGFLFIATVLQNFEIIVPGGDPSSVDIQSGSGLTRTPKPYKIIAKPR